MWVLLPLFIMLVCGAVSFFRGSLKAWHIPALQQPFQETDNTLLSPNTKEVIQSIPSDTSLVSIKLPKEESPLTEIRHRSKGQKFTSTGITTEGEIIPPSRIDSKVIETIYKWHYLQPFPGGRYIAGLVALIWLTLTINGFYLHRKKLFSQFNFRKKRTGNTFQSWLHTITATVTLPFHFIYGITGVIFNLSIVALPVTMMLSFQGNRDAMMEQLTGVPAEPKPSKELVAKLPDIQPFINQAKLELQHSDTKLNLILIKNPYDQKGTLNLRFSGPHDYKAEVQYLLNESTDPIFVNHEQKTSGINKVLTPIFKLHFGRYGWFIKCIYLLMTAFLCLLVTAGARLYIKRKQSTLPRATKFFERVFDGFGIGIFPAIAIFALSNRLLPEGLSNRGSIEIYVFHISWILIGLFPLIFGTGPKLRKIFYYSALSGLFLIPLLDGLLSQNWPWSEQLWIVPIVGRTNIILLILLPAVALLHFAFTKARSAPLNAK